MTAAVTRALTRVASVAAVGVLAGALALLATPARASAGTTERVSADRRVVAFAAAAANRGPGDAKRRDVFVHDRLAGTTELGSMDSGGIQGNGWSYSPAISADGRFVAFDSSASNLVPGDTDRAG